MKSTKAQEAEAIVNAMAAVPRRFHARKSATSDKVAEIRAGDVVSLKHGRTRMTVERVRASADDGMAVDCVWFEEGDLRRATFAVAALQKKEDE